MCSTVKSYPTCRGLLIPILALTACVCFRPLAAHGEPATNKEPARTERWFQYTNEVNDGIPWSIHVVKLERASSDYEFVTTSGAGKTLGMGTVSQQIKTLPHELGQPVAAINGDFYDRSEEYQGRPRDLQVRQGEVISSPSGHTCFWLDSERNPHMTNVYSRFRVTWPDGKEIPIGLNEAREDGTAVLYTAAVGASTRTKGGRELFLDCPTDPAWLPLRLGEEYGLRVREIRDSGNSPLGGDRVVLSLGPSLAARLAKVNAGATLRVFTETLPALKGIDFAIGGGPSLVEHSKAMQWTGFIHMRHPRSAIGWNKDYFFLVVVDGRQSNVSVGMTFPELANYLVKLGCEQAMNFDGGGSTTLWALGTVRNSPSEGDERPSANALVVVRKR